MRIWPVLSVLCAVPLTAACGAHSELRTFPSAGITSLSVATGAGDISVEGSTGTIRVEITGYDRENCFLTVKTDNGQLILKVEDSAAVIARAHPKYSGVAASSGTFDDYTGCRAGFTVAAPPKLPLKTQALTGDIAVHLREGEVGTDTGTGDIKVDGISGDLTARTGSGAISGSVCSRNMRVRTGSGEVALAGLCGSADAKAASGSLKLQWAVVPATGAVRAETYSGDLTLIFPPSAGIAARLESASGLISNDFDEPGKFPISAGSGSGNVSIRKAGE